MLIPTSLMGMAVPALAKEIGKAPHQFSQTIGSVYSVNSFGGAAGSFMAGFFILISMGITGSNYLASSISIVVACIAFLIQTNTKKIALYTPCQPSNSINRSLKVSYPIFYALLGLTFVSGFTSLGYEILWLRLFVPVLESTTYTFSIVLSVFLCGLGFGNWLYYTWLKNKPNILYYAALIEIAVGAYALCSTHLFGSFFGLGITLYNAMGVLTWEKTVLAKAILTFAVLIIPTTLFGILLPLISSVFSSSLNTIGRGVGDVFSINMLGSILGSTITGFTIIPFLGVRTGMITLGVLNISAGVLFLIIIRPTLKIAAAVLPLLFAAAGIITLVWSTPLLTPLPGETIIYYKEGLSGNVEVSKNRRGYTLLRVDNKTHGGNEPWVIADEVRIAHFSLFLHPDPQDVLVIGLGTGITLDAIARHNLHSIDCVEIVGELTETLPYFFNGKPEMLDRQEVSIIIEDGRNYILRTEKKYDVIIMDLIHPESASAGNLFTKEYYEHAGQLLSPGGLVAQWLPLYQLSPQEVQIIMRTFSSTFPYASLWFGSHSKNFPLALLVGSHNELFLEKDDIQHRLDASALTKELVEQNNAEHFLDNFILDKEEIEAAIQRGPINTDNAPVLDFLVPKGLLHRNQYREKNVLLLKNLHEKRQWKNTLR